MRFTYTLVVYRPNGVDTCRNCVMGTSNSDFEIEVFNDMAALAEWKAKHFFSRTKDREYCDPEYTLLLDGLREDDERGDDSEERYEERRACERLFSAALARLNAEAAERKRLAQQDAERKAAEAAAEATAKREKAERAQYMALKAKFGDVNG